MFRSHQLTVDRTNQLNEILILYHDTKAMKPALLKDIPRRIGKVQPFRMFSILRSVRMHKLILTEEKFQNKIRLGFLGPLSAFSNFQVKRI